MKWQQRYFKGKKVWVQVDASGDPVVEDGRVPMRYQNDDNARIYRASPRNISSRTAAEIDAQRSGDTESGGSSGTKSTARPIKASKAFESRGPLRESSTVPDELCSVEEPPEGVIEIHTDGACSGNPGPCGYGVVIRDGFHYREMSQFLGHGTNNIAELMAINVGLQAVQDKSRPVRLYTDSSYCIGVLSKGWKAKANRELILSIRERIKDFDDLELHKVKGHSDHPLNDRADLLATSSVEDR